MQFFYTSDMPGAPALHGGAGAPILNVLDACLVTGFNLQPLASLEVAAGIATGTVAAGHGLVRPVRIQITSGGPLTGLHALLSAPDANTFTFPASGIPDGSYSGASVRVAPAGWTKPFVDTDIGVYRSGDAFSTQTYYRFRVDSSETRKVYHTAFEAMTSASVGTGQFPAFSYPDGYYFQVSPSSTSTPRKWMIVATESFFIFLAAKYESDAALNNGFTGIAIGDIPPLWGYDEFTAICTYGNLLGTHPNEDSASPLSGRPFNIRFRRRIDQSTIDSSGELSSRFSSNGISLLMGVATDNKLVIDRLMAVENWTTSNRNPRGWVPYLWVGFSHPTSDALYPTGQIIDGAAGSEVEGRKLYCVNAGRIIGASTTDTSRRRAFFDVTELMPS